MDPARPHTGIGPLFPAPAGIDPDLAWWRPWWIWFPRRGPLCTPLKHKPAPVWVLEACRSAA